MICDNNFWINNPDILYKNSQYLNFIPSSNMDKYEQLNAITRLCIYIVLLLIFTNQSTHYIQMPVFIIIFMVCLYFISKYNNEHLSVDVLKTKGIDINSSGDEDYNNKKYEKPEKEKNIIIKTGYYDSNNNLRMGEYEKPKKEIDTNYEQSICRVPTKDNPFMNPLLDDISVGDRDEIQPIACNVDDDEIKDKIVDCFNKDLYRDVGDLFERQNSQRQFYSLPQSFPNDQNAFAQYCYGNKGTCKTNQGLCLKNEDLRFKRLNLLN